jgi:hypothetical protein
MPTVDIKLGGRRMNVDSAMEEMKAMGKQVPNQGPISERLNKDKRGCLGPNRELWPGPEGGTRRSHRLDLINGLGALLTDALVANGESSTLFSGAQRPGELTRAALGMASLACGVVAVLATYVYMQGKRVSRLSRCVPNFRADRCSSPRCRRQRQLQLDVVGMVCCHWVYYESDIC